MKDVPKTALLLGAVFVAAFAGCAFGCMVAIRLGASGDRESAAHSGAGHRWMHEQLDITENQNEGLAAIEARFAEREEALRARLSNANGELGRVLKEDRAYSPRVEASVDEIHNAMAELQKATIEHLIEMEAVLTPDQFSRLLELAGEALSE